MLKAIVISNGIQGLETWFRSNENIEYTVHEITKDFDPALSEYDMLIVPNGSDQIAMVRIKEKVRTFLDAGNMLLCFDGFFTDWIPGNQWIMSNDLKTIDVRYHLVHDKYHLLKNIDMQKLNYSHGMSGWWACGYIETENKNNILLADTLNRAIMVVDESTTKGMMILTASGPLADIASGDEETASSWNELGKIYRNIIDMIITKKEKQLQLTEENR